MSLRVRLALSTLAVTVPMVIGLIWLDARSRHRAAEAALAELGEGRLALPGERERCEAAPAAWAGDVRGRGRPPRGRPDGPDRRERAGRPPDGPRTDRQPAPPRRDGPMPGVRAAPPTMMPYDAALRSVVADAPHLDAALLDTLGGRTWIAVEGSVWSDRVAVLVRQPWDDGPCALVLVRGSTTRGFLGAILPASDVWLAPVLGMLLAVVIAVGPFVGQVQRLTAQVERSAAAGFVDDPVASPRGPAELRALGDAFASASAEVRRQLAARDDRERVLREFLANTTHDVMIPLTVLTQHLASLRGGARADDAAVVDRTVAQAMDEAHYLAALLHNLAAAATLDVTEPRLERSPIDVNAVVGRVVARHRPIADERGVEIEAGVPEDAVVIDADLTLFEQAISNVVYNAVRHNRRGGHVAVVVEHGDGRFVVRILDDGPGIPPPDLGRLVERGWKQDAARTRSTGAHGGHGIGLDITNTVAHLHGYQLAFRNRAPSGLEVELAGPTAAAAAAT